MTLFGSFLQSKSNKWIEDREAKLSLQFQDRLKSLDDRFSEELLRKESEILRTQKEIEVILSSSRELRISLTEKEISARKEHDEKISSLEKQYMEEKASAEKAIFEISINFEKERESLNGKRSILRVHELEIDELERQIEVKKATLERLSRDLSEQIRILEAKARPDQVWMQAFGDGFSKALSLIPSFDEKIKKSIETHAIEGTLKRLNHGNLLPKNQS